MQFKEKLMKQTWENGKKPNFGPNFGPQKIFVANFIIVFDFHEN